MLFPTNESNKNKMRGREGVDRHILAQDNNCVQILTFNENDQQIGNQDYQGAEVAYEQTMKAEQTNE